MKVKIDLHGGRHLLLTVSEEKGAKKIVQAVENAILNKMPFIANTNNGQFLVPYGEIRLVSWIKDGETDEV